MIKLSSLLVVAALFLSLFGYSQSLPIDSAALKIYRGAAPKINDLVHTKLDLSFDYDKCYAFGKAWITLKPHGYNTDTLTLNARGMDIHAVSIIKASIGTPLKYTYDGLLLRIRLDKSYHPGERYIIYISYTAKPNEISNAMYRGLFFVNPKGLEKENPTQIWTVGEMEQNSSWFPTIDRPNQKSTEEIILTVPSKYVTMSNGKLISQKPNTGGTRTDHWVMDRPNAPYLFSFVVGDYAIVKDQYKGMEVNYYVERQYEKYARKTFGSTPAMIGYIEKILGVPYPWVKYDQITANDLPFSIENTSSTLHGFYAQMDDRDLSEGIRYETGICHELFHQWFGDLVTTESWSNLTVNESFANLSETLWATYREGKDAGDAVNHWAMMGYLSDSAAATKNLVRFYYSIQNDMLDGSVTYNKGGRILNMLKTYLGDSIFFKSLNLYLNTHKFKNAEAQDLRLAFEEMSGQDLNWYWNQWYYGSGHPKFSMDYIYDDVAAKASVIIRQTQHTGKIFRIPLDIDLYEGKGRRRYPVWIENEVDTFTFTYQQRPSLINVDGEKIILCEKQDNKTLDNFIFQYYHAASFMDRLEAIEFCARHQDNAIAVDFLKQTLKDRFADLRKLTIEKLDFSNESIRTVFSPLLVSLAVNDPNAGVRGAAIQILGSFKRVEYKDLFIKAARDSSYSTSGIALEALDSIDSSAAFILAVQLSTEPAKWKLSDVIFNLIIKDGSEIHANQLNALFRHFNLFQRMGVIMPYIKYQYGVKSIVPFKESLDQIIAFRNFLPESVFSDLIKLINTELRALADQKTKEGLKELADYINLLLK